MTVMTEALEPGDRSRVFLVTIVAFYVVFVLGAGYIVSLLGPEANTPVDRDIAINMLNDIATVSGILIGFVSVLAGDNLSTILRGRIDQQADTVRFRQYIRDRTALLAMDAIYIAGFAVVALWSILSLLNVGESNKQSLVYGPFLMLAAVSFALILRVIVSFVIEN